MGFKHSIWGRFFGPKQETVRDKQVPTHLTCESKETQTIIATPPIPTVKVELELPQEHALNRLCDLRVQRAGGQLRPRLALEGREDLSNEQLKRELGRLQRAVTLAANSRLKKVTSREPKAPMKVSGKAASSIEEGTRTKKQENLPEEQNAPPLDMDALPFVYIAADKLSAWLMVFPPIGDGKELNQEHLENALKDSGVTYGVDAELLKRLPEDPKKYFSLYSVARGKPAVQGKDGYVKEMYDRVVERKFEVDEHDRVDYASLKFFQSVEKGDVLCEAVQPIKGDPGRTVQDQEIPVKDGKAAPLNKGRNTEISQDGTKLLASQAGHLEFSGKAFHVKSVMEIDGDVDYSTGNINYMGDVHIHGNVSSGFTVKAVGNITVDGVVKSGNIEAGGDLIVAKGIVGNSQSIVKAKRNIYAKYLENSNVHAKQNLQADSIVNSNVYCDGNIEVRSGRGIIVGGRIRAARRISAKIVGSKMESQTFIFLGGEPCVEFDRQALVESIESGEKELEKLEKRPNSPSKIDRMKSLEFELSVDRVKLEQMDEEIAHYDEEVQSHGGCRLTCDLAYSGIILNINDVMFKLKNETSMCNARLVDGEIQMS